MKIRIRIIAMSLCVFSAFTARSTMYAAAVENPFSFVVSSGEYSRTNALVRIGIEVPESLADVKTAALVDHAGNTYAGQLAKPRLLSRELSPNVRELHFILTELAPGEELALTATLAGPSEISADGFIWKDAEGKFNELSVDGRPVLRYMYETHDKSTEERRRETYKVYHHVYSPDGNRLVTKGSGGLYPHHRGLFYGFNNISYGDQKRVDTWHCGGGEWQSHEGFVASEEGPVLGRHRVAVNWHGRDGKVFAKEEREMTVYNLRTGTLIEFASRLESTVSHLKLDGDPQHAGFQFRASQEVPDKTKDLTYYLRPDGKGEPGKFRNWPDDKQHVNLPWNALSFVLDDQRYTCCYLDHPLNPKETRYSERDYGRFGAYFVAELMVKEKLDLNYRIWLQNGEMTVEQVQTYSNDFVTPVGIEKK